MQSLRDTVRGGMNKLMASRGCAHKRDLIEDCKQAIRGAVVLGGMGSLWDLFNMSYI